MSILWTIIIGFCGGGDREILSSWQQVRAQGVYFNNAARDCWSFCGYIPRPGGRVVSSWRRRWVHWGNRWRDHSLGGVGDDRTSS